MSVDVSIIIPTLDEETEIGRTLATVSRIEGVAEIIVVDGSSTDQTRDISRQLGVTVVTAERGRGGQLHAGALAATGSVLWFLHADSIPPKDAIGQIHEALSDDGVAGGNFLLRFDGDSLAAAFMTRFYDKIRYLGLLYGDSGIFVRRDAYHQAGGFKPLPLFEDLEFVGRLKRQGKLVRVKSTIVTSSRRFEGRPFISVFVRWVLYQGLYWIGISPFRLSPGYRPIRRDADGKVDRINFD
ncbi:MAG: TIGR04283 family arsenosugar biosynthesis glycosyltransferase [Blastocatellia bacterium]